MKLLKVLDKGMISPYQGFQFELGKEYTCSDFCDDTSKDCAPGFYATELDGLPYAYRTFKEVYEVEVSGKSVEFDVFKRRYERIKIIRKVEISELMHDIDKWEKKVGYRLREVLCPVNPMLIDAEECTQQEIDLLKQWSSVGGLVIESVWESMEKSVGYAARNLVRNSVGEPVGYSVEYSVEYSVGSSLWETAKESVRWAIEAYCGSLFTGITEWKHVSHEPGVYPFDSGAQLWRRGFVPVYYSGKWRLFAGNPMKEIYIMEVK